MNNDEKINSGRILEEIRSTLGLTIDEFCIQMGWKSPQHYYAIRDGMSRKGIERKKTSPTVNKLFDGINLALRESPNWADHKEEIKEILMRELIKENA